MTRARLGTVAALADMHFAGAQVAGLCDGLNKIYGRNVIGFV